VSPSHKTAWRCAAGACAALFGAAVIASEKPSQMRDGSESPPRNDAASGWASEASTKDLTIYSRMRDGTALKEFKGVGVIDATPAAVFAVLDDSEAYPSFMPYTAECRVLRRDKDIVLAYQRLQLPLVSDRDYTLRSKNAKWLGPAGPIYRIRWEPANDLGPAEKEGVLRVNVCEGGWLLEPEADGATRATYSIFTDSGGALPSFVANNGSRIAIRKVFDAIRKQVKQPKYTAMKN
jgi:hypothetical protein